LTNPTNLLEYLAKGGAAKEVTGHVQIGTRALGRAEADAAGTGGAAGPVRQPGTDGTLLAVVPIPGTGTSLAIVGYPVTALPGTDFAAGTDFAVGAVPAAPVPGGAVPGGAIPGQPAGTRPGLLLDHEQRRVWVDGAEVTLTFQEFELLAFLAAHPSTVFSRADLVRTVWQRDFAADSRTVDVHVSRLRHKLGPSYGRYLVTEYRVGYQFRP
jgi:Transcriptional regulatory protein, C terminal